MHQKLIKYLPLFGPAWLVMMADVDGSSIIGAAQVGSNFGYGFVLIFLALTLPLYVIQEVSGRVGAVTGKGLGTLVREVYGRKRAGLVAVPMFVTDTLTYAVEYISIGIGLSGVGIPPIVGISLAFVVHLLVVARRGYLGAERLLLKVSGVFFLALLATAVLRGGASSSILYFSTDPNYLFLLASSVGAVIMPFMLFFQASATGIKIGDLKARVGRELNLKRVIRGVRAETLAGAFASEVLMILVEVAFTGVPSLTDPFASGEQLAKALSVVAGPYAAYLFALGLASASFLALVVISLGSSWGIVEALGLKEEWTFRVYLLESVPAYLASLLLPQRYLMSSVLYLLALFDLVVIGPLLVLGMIAKDERVMGEFRLSGLNEAAYWAFGGLILALGILGIFT
jgi:Mn2+ and Fe2+ transporters of the NRAMP family